jgi:uncharacterized membrane protein YozB (DUF420 family)
MSFIYSIVSIVFVIMQLPTEVYSGEQRVLLSRLVVIYDSLYATVILAAMIHISRGVVKGGRRKSIVPPVWGVARNVHVCRGFT